MEHQHRFAPFGWNGSISILLDRALLGMTLHSLAGRASDKHRQGKARPFVTDRLTRGTRRMCEQEQQSSTRTPAPPRFWLLAILLERCWPRMLAPWTSRQILRRSRSYIWRMARPRPVRSVCRPCREFFAGGLRQRGRRRISPGTRSAPSSGRRPPSARSRPAISFHQRPEDVLFGSSPALDDKQAELEYEASAASTFKIQPPSPSSTGAMRRFDLSGPQWPGGVEGASGREELCEDVGPTDDRPRRCVDRR